MNVKVNSDNQIVIMMSFYFPASLLRRIYMLL